jgi:hypothetical protein
VGLVNLSNETNYAAGANAVGTTVRSDLEALRDEINGSLNTANIANSGVDTDQLAADAVENAKIADGAVREAQVSFDTPDGLLVPRVGPNYNSEGATDSAPRISMVSMAHTFSAATAEDITVNFNGTNCVDGAPAFSTEPHLLGVPVFIRDTATIGDMPNQVYVKSIAPGSCVVHVERVNTTAVGVTIEFGVMGAIAT